MVLIKKANKMQRMRNIAEYYVNNNSTVRETAEYFGLSKSYVHRVLEDFQDYCVVTDKELVMKVANQISTNIAERSKRGGQIAKEKLSKNK